MLLNEPLDFAKDFISKINSAISAEKPGSKLSLSQQWWLAFCISAIIITNSVCWARFERISLGKVTLSALSWMFTHSKLPWELLLVYSLRTLLTVHGITGGVLVLDDSDRRRSKNTQKIAHVHKAKDKKSGGYINAQEMVFLVLVSAKITIPISFAFYNPDPIFKVWQKENRRLKKAGVSKRNRPKKPERDPRYPTKQTLALKLLNDFANDFPEIKAKCIVADALYGSNHFMSQAKQLFGGIQVISQLRTNQIIRSRGREKSVQEYFRSNPGVATTLAIRGGAAKAVVMGGARLWVKSHQAKRFVIAMRYEGEQEDRYIVATDITWRMTDIASAYTIRWLVEVFIFDWKSFEGWCQMAKQPGVEGSDKGLILSLLVDHALLSHPDQTAILEHKLPALTVGSLREKIRFDAIIDFMRQLLNCENPAQELERYIDKIKQVIELAPSNKHMNHRDMGRLEPTPSLKYIIAA